MPNFLDTLYGALLAGAGPALLASRLLRRRKLGSLRGKLGLLPSHPGSPGAVWIHGVSVGEIRMARALVDVLARERPDLEIVLSSTTPAGHAVARRDHPDRHVFWFPLDFSFSVARVLASIRPSLLVLMELEVWPNLMDALGRRGIPVAVVNGRMSDRSFPRYRLLTRILPTFFGGISLFCARDAAVARRLAELGLPPDRIRVTGSLKADTALLAAERGDGALRRSDLGMAPDDFVVVAGSTHEGEERLLLDAYELLRQELPSLRLVIAPRHLERIPGILALAASRGVVLGRRSLGAPAGSDRVILLDTMGELHAIYALADAAVLGGTFVPVGGHNLVEPAVHGVPIVIGPHVSAIAGEAAEFIAGGGALPAADLSGLTGLLRELGRDPALRAAAGARARELLAAGLGAAGRTFEALRPLLGAPRDRRDPAAGYAVSQGV